jgi:hypothetical protein
VPEPGKGAEAKSLLRLMTSENQSLNRDRSSEAPPGSAESVLLIRNSGHIKFEPILATPLNHHPKELQWKTIQR